MGALGKIKMRTFFTDHNHKSKLSGNFALLTTPKEEGREWYNAPIPQKLVIMGTSNYKFSGVCLNNKPPAELILLKKLVETGGRLSKHPVLP